MIGAIAGDIIGSVYEHRPVKTKDFPLFDVRCDFTDDTVLTIAIADAILGGKSYLDSVRRIGKRYPGAGYGATLYTGRRSINPLAAICAMQMMPATFGEDNAADAVEKAVMYVTGNKLKSLRAGRMGYSTSQVGGLVAEKVAEQSFFCGASALPEVKRYGGRAPSIPLCLLQGSHRMQG